MIFVTVGTQLPFDRLIGVINRWAGESGEEVVAQIGNSNEQYLNLRTFAMLTPEEARKCFERAEFIVSHAGIGSILTAMQFGKKIVIFPRRASLGEHRNEHQLATAKRFSGKYRNILIAFNEDELIDILNRSRGFSMGDFSVLESPDELISNLRRIIFK